MDELLQKVKDNLILSHDKDDELAPGIYPGSRFPMRKVTSISPPGIMRTIPCRPPQNRLLSCCPPIFTKAGMAPQAASSQIMLQAGAAGLEYGEPAAAA